MPLISSNKKTSLYGRQRKQPQLSFVSLSWVAPLRSLAHIVTFIDPLNQNLFKKHPGVIPNYQGVRHILSGKNTEEFYLNAGKVHLFKSKSSREVILHNLWILLHASKLLLTPFLCRNCAQCCRRGRNIEGEITVHWGFLVHWERQIHTPYTQSGRP